MGASSRRFYFAGDSAHRDADGYYWIMGRIDDVLNVAGHRLGTMEIESALVAHPRVAEAAVVGRPHEIKGKSVFAYVVCKGSRPTGNTAAFEKELRDWVSEQLGAIARPEEIRFADNLPKTRSGKIMRRLLRAIARNEEITQDVSTLENPAIIDQLRGVDRSAASASRKQSKTSTAKPVAKRSVHKRKSASTAAERNRREALTHGRPRRNVRHRRRLNHALKSRAAARRAPVRKKK